MSEKQVCKYAFDVYQCLRQQTPFTFNLSSLSLVSLDMNDKMVVHMINNLDTKLKNLNLKGNPIQDEGITALFDWLKNCDNSITALNISDIPITNRGMDEFDRRRRSSLFVSL
eukprot:TRINITY_DN2050_c0_g3_i2.p1 TRINITY_DN2050_c0_g3~~TRINITY_DN2050_c0_g3_i2.p1  ORF type:complete len:113 (+),score=19.75 TRINITY_DN2050_c0_g3_i2:77-415(+)